jgi:hypothetical protein
VPTIQPTRLRAKLAATRPRSRYIACTAASTASARVSADDQRGQHAGGNERGGSQIVKRAVRGVSAEQQQPEQREDDLCERLRRGADGNGGGRVAHAHAALGQLPHHHHRAADLTRRQQAIHRFADPAREQRIAQRDVVMYAVVPALEQRRDRAGVEHQRHEVERRDEHEPPACRSQRRGNGAEPLPCEQADKKRRPDRQQNQGRASHASSFPRFVI